MQKSELKTGMLVTLRNKEQYYVMLNTGLCYKANDILLKRYGKTEMGWMPLAEYTDTLEFCSGPDDIFAEVLPFETTHEMDRQWDIVQVASVFEPTDLCIPDRYKPIWTREEVSE